MAKTKKAKGLAEKVRSRPTRGQPTSSSGELTTGEKVAVSAIGAAVLGLMGLAVGTQKGRQFCGDVIDASAAYDQRCRAARMSREEYKVQLQKTILDKKLELCRLEAHSGLFDDTWDQKSQLRREIRVLEDEVSRM